MALAKIYIKNVADEVIERPQISIRFFFYDGGGGAVYFMYIADEKSKTIFFATFFSINFPPL